MANYWRYCVGCWLDVVRQYVRKNVLMNERILQLAAEAKIMTEESINMKISFSTQLKAFSETFSKLIVKECIEGIKEWRDASDEHMDKEEYWKGYRSGCNDAIVEIIQRLGVNE